jgi:hypothetical protein
MSPPVVNWRFSLSASLHSGKGPNSISISPRPLPSTHIPIHYSVIIPQFDYWTLAASLRHRQITALHYFTTLYRPTASYVIKCNAVEVWGEACPGLFHHRLILRNLREGTSKIYKHMFSGTWGSRAADNTLGILRMESQYSSNIICLTQNTRNFVRSLTQ